MAITPDFYVDLDLATGLNDGSSWANAYQTVSAMLGGFGSGLIGFISHDCQEAVSVDTTLQYTGDALPVVLISVDKDNSNVYTPQTTTPQITTGTNNVDINLGSNISVFGMYFSAGAEFGVTNNSNNGVAYMEDCIVDYSTHATQRQDLKVIALAQGYFKNCTLNCASTDASQTNVAHTTIEGPAFLRLDNCTFTADTASYIDGPIFEVGIAAIDTAVLIVNGGDCSTLTSASAVFDTSGDASIIHCDGLKLPSGVSFYAGNEDNDRFPEKRVTRYNANTYSLYDYTPHGSTTAGTTNVRTGGASDGTTFSWAVTTESNCEVGAEYATPEISVWVDSTGSKTFDIYINSDDVLTDTQCWPEIEYHDTASESSTALASSRNADIQATGTTLTADTSTWTTNNNRYKLSVTATVNTVGYVSARVLFATDLTDTCYVDPKITVT